MPVLILDRLPLPNLRAYTSISVILLSASIYYAVHTTSDPKWKTNSTAIPIPEPIIEGLSNETRSVGEHVMETITFMVQEPICIWTLINMAYCGLILLGKSIQRIVFGELRVSERHHLKDKFWNFVFYKFIFVFGVVNVQFMEEVTLWCSWFSILGFLHLLSQLCKDRFEYLSFSPTTPGWSHARLVGLLSSILFLSGFLFLVCVGVGYFGGLNTFAFMAAECVLLTLRNQVLWVTDFQNLQWRGNAFYIDVKNTCYILPESDTWKDKSRVQSIPPRKLNKIDFLSHTLNYCIDSIIGPTT